MKLALTIMNLNLNKTACNKTTTVHYSNKISRSLRVDILVDSVFQFIGLLVPSRKLIYIISSVQEWLIQQNNEGHLYLCSIKFPRYCYSNHELISHSRFSKFESFSTLLSQLPQLKRKTIFRLNCEIHVPRLQQKLDA